MVDAVRLGRYDARETGENLHAGRRVAEVVEKRAVTGSAALVVCQAHCLSPVVDRKRVGSGAADGTGAGNRVGRRDAPLLRGGGEGRGGDERREPDGPRRKAYAD